MAGTVVAQPSNQPRIAFYTLGCKVNQAETDLLSRSFREQGFLPVSFDQVADAYVVNTCTVTHVGDAKSRQVLRQAQRRNPDALIIATGCYASIVRDRLPIANVLVVPNRDKDHILDIVCRHIDQASRSSLDSFTDKPAQQGLASNAAPFQRTRPMVKVQDGCNSACSYCIIPRARGRSRSIDPTAAVAQVQRWSDEGHLEVVITGVDLGSYGEDRGDLPDLGGLLRRILDETTVHRIRVSSVEPGDFDADWLGLWENQRLCRHLHIPLQSGSDHVLRAMKRTYTSVEFFRMLEVCREEIPGLTVTTDVIVGFPGETDDEFEASLSFIQSCRFDGLHVFQYSRRPGTAAAHLPDAVQDTSKKERSARLLEIGRQATSRLAREAVGTEVEVVWESQREGVWRGLTDTNIRVFATDIPNPHVAERRRLTATYLDGCWAERTNIGALPIAI